MRIRDEQKEIAIREKAIEMIVDKGFDGLSMQKLAKAAGVSPATIYIYFKNREDLLNQIYITVYQTFSEEMLKGFHPEMDFREGLWLQWKNRFNYIKKYPLYFMFQEQFRNSPLVRQNDIYISGFKESMKAFIMNAIKKGQVPKMEPEIFWAIAYAPFYALIKFHINNKSMMNNSFVFTEVKMKTAFDMLIKAFKN